MAEPLDCRERGQFDALVEQFASSQWTDRKRAVEQLVHLASELSPDDDEFAILVRRLVEGVIEPATVDSRAACHETVARLGRDAMPFVLERLDGCSEAGRRALVDLLGTFGGEQEVPLLGGLLQNPGEDANVRAAAATALGAIGGDAAVGMLAPCLADAGEVLGLFVLDGLRLCRARLPLATLEPYLDNPLTCRCAVSLLGSSKDVDALVVLGRLLERGSAGVRAEAVKASAALWAELEPGDRDLETRARAVLSTEAWTGVYTCFDHRDDAVVRAAITLAVQARQPGALAKLAVREQEPWVAERVATLVARLGRGANPPLRELLAAAERPQVSAALVMMAAMDPASVDDALRDEVVAYISHDDDALAGAAIEAVGRLGTGAAVHPLFRRCGDRGPLGEQAASALIDVVRHDSPAGASMLDALLHEPWPSAGALASNLCRIVRQLGLRGHVPNLVALSSSDDVDVRLAAVQGLGALSGTQEGVAVLSLALADEDARVRAAACRSLGALEAEEACEALLSATRDEHASVRAAAVQALVAFDNVVARSRYREIVLDDPSPSVIVYAVAGLSRSRREDDLSLLMSLCAASDIEVVKAAARALAEFRPHRATAALIGLFAHERWDVRRAAAQALGQRRDVTALGPLRRAHRWEQDPLVQQAMGEAVAALEGVGEAT